MAKWMPIRADVDTAFADALNANIDTLLLADDQARAAAHDRDRDWPPDRLAASRLAWPLQWQALKSLGCPPREVDAYARRLFLRGRQCEDWLVDQLKAMTSFGDVREQVPIDYREAVGYIDVRLKREDLDLPIEIKSVAGMKFKRVKSQGGPDRSHALQAGLYGSAIGANACMVLYIAADDFRVLPYLMRVADVRPEVDQVIDRFQAWRERCAILGAHVPAFVAEEQWQANPKYCSFPEWVGLDEQECAIKLALERDTWKTENPG